MTANRPTLADLRLTGTQSEIGLTLTALASAGLTWTNNGRYYPQRNEPSKFSFYLSNVQWLPPTTTAAPSSDEPQPGPYDAVLGGKGRSNP